MTQLESVSLSADSVRIVAHGAATKSDLIVNLLPPGGARPEGRVRLDARRGDGGAASHVVDAVAAAPALRRHGGRHPHRPSRSPRKRLRRNRKREELRAARKRGCGHTLWRIQALLHPNPGSAGVPQRGQMRTEPREGTSLLYNAAPMDSSKDKDCEPRDLCRDLHFKVTCTCDLHRSWSSDSFSKMRFFARRWRFSRSWCRLHESSRRASRDTFVNTRRCVTHGVTSERTPGVLVTRETSFKQPETRRHPVNVRQLLGFAK